MKGNKIRGALWIGVIAANTLLSGTYLLITAAGVFALYISVPCFPRCLGTIRFWLVVGMPVLLSFVAPAIDFADGLLFAAKGAIFLVLVEYLRRRISPRRIGLFMDRMGLGGLGFAFSVAINSLASAGDKVRSVWSTIRMRGGFRRRPAAGLRTFLEAVLYAVLLQGEEIYLAARAKGYGDTL